METWYMYEYAELQFRNNVGVKIGETWKWKPGPEVNLKYLGDFCGVCFKMQYELSRMNAMVCI